MKKLPIGLNSLEKIVEGNYIYVDKTKHLLNLIDSGNYFFLSRPRRFGKTLTIDTLKNIFEGNKDIFKGLYIYDSWDWDKRYPVIRVDFSVGLFNSSDNFIERVNAVLREHQKKFDIRYEEEGFVNRFHELIIKTYKKYGMQVVILIDEYDKPILDNIEKPELAEEIRDLLSNFYGVIKGLDGYLRFVLLTGVTKFSKVNLFSKLNNLYDITISKNFSSICGYTEDELDVFFNEHLKGADREKLQLWYNGYSWLGERVYNPFDILIFIADGFRFRPYWFETGTPTFLMKLIKNQRYFIPNLESIEATDALLGSFDVYTMEIEALLWQTGYLTIKDTKEIAGRLKYVLSYPNLEVKISLNEFILKFLTKIETNIYSRTQEEIYNALMRGDVDSFIENLKALFSQLPYTNFTKNDIASYEGFYASVVYSYLASIGVDLRAEDITNKGRIDLTILLDDKAYIIEFKVIDSDKEEKEPLMQIKEKGYFEKYKGKFKDIYLVGIVFSKEKRNIKEWIYELRSEWSEQSPDLSG